MAKPRCRNCGGQDWTPSGRCAACREFPTLGYLVWQWIEGRCVVPDGDYQGEPYLLTDEMARFTLRHYRVNPHARRDKRGQWRLPFVYFRGSQLVRPQKWGKGPFVSALVCAECAPDGPVLFDGWDANGQPVGRPWATPWWQITAVSEAQTDNVWRALRPMIELGALAADIPDTGLTRINLPGGGLIEPVTSAASSRLGQRITGAVEDETHDWKPTNGGRKLADTQRRNLAGTGGRFLETTNAWNPADKTVAQGTAEDGEPGVHRDDVEPGTGSVRNKADRRRMLRKVYGDSWWVDLERIDGEIIALLKRDAPQAERFFLNRKRAGESAGFDPERVKTLTRPDVDIPAGSLIVVGIDGARFVDALAMVATHVESGHQWSLGIWETPSDAPDDYEHPFVEIDGALSEAFERFYVWRAYVDPQYIEDWLRIWQGRWGEKRVVPWRTNRPRQIAWAVRNYTDAMAAGDWSHNGHEKFIRHLHNARKQPLAVLDDKARPMHTLAKESPDSPLKMDGAMAGVLAWEARGDAIAADAKPPSRTAAFI